MDPFRVVRLAGDALDRCRAASNGPSTATAEVITLARTLKKRAADVLTYFERLARPTVRPRR